MQPQRAAQDELTDLHRQTDSTKRPIAKEKEELFYDLVLSCRLSDLCDDNFSKSQGACGHWHLKFSHGLKKSCYLERWAGHAVGILGQYNKGKTWILGRLSNCQFPGESKVARTEGLSLKWVETTVDGFKQDTYHHLVIDTLGFNTPVAFSGVNSAESSTVRPSVSGDNVKSQSASESGAYNRLQDMKNYEQFLENMTIDLSGYLLVVMSENIASDQRFLFQTVWKWCESNTIGKCTEVFVLHNFRNTEDAGERERLFSQSTERILDGKKGRVRGVSFFVCPALRTRHVCLMDDKKGRAYNDAVFTVIKLWIYNILPPPLCPCTPDEFVKRFAEYSSRYLSERGFLENVKNIQFQETDDGKLIYHPVKCDPRLPVVQIRSDHDKFYSSLDDFRPSCSVRYYRSQAGSECKIIQIEAPGVQMIKVKPSYKKSTMVHWALEVSGRKVKSDIRSYLRRNERISNNTRLVPANDPVKTVFDSCRYGEFSEVFQIPLRFQMCDWTILGPYAGVFMLLFKEDPGVSSEDDQ